MARHWRVNGVTPQSGDREKYGGFRLGNGARAFANKRQVDREVIPETTLGPPTRFPKRGTEVSNAEIMTKAIYQGFILWKDAYKLPARFVMPIVAGNPVVRGACGVSRAP
jgi:hypothetical protein